MVPTGAGDDYDTGLVLKTRQNQHPLQCTIEKDA